MRHDSMTQNHRSIPRCYCSIFWQLFISFFYLSFYVSIFAHSDVCSFSSSVEMRAYAICAKWHCLWCEFLKVRYVMYKSTLFSTCTDESCVGVSKNCLSWLCNRTDVQRGLWGCHFELLDYVSICVCIFDDIFTVIHIFIRNLFETPKNHVHELQSHTLNGWNKWIWIYCKERLSDTVSSSLSMA